MIFLLNLIKTYIYILIIMFLWIENKIKKCLNNGDCGLGPISIKNFEHKIYNEIIY